MLMLVEHAVSARTCVGTPTRKTQAGLWRAVVREAWDVGWKASQGSLAV